MVSDGSQGILVAVVGEGELAGTCTEAFTGSVVEVGGGVEVGGLVVGAPLDNGCRTGPIVFGCPALVLGEVGVGTP